jgi:xanthine dehydrogenase accessory factor
MKTIILRGGGDLASGVALRLYRCGFKIVIAELAQPLAVRRSVSFSESIYESKWIVEDVSAIKIDQINEIDRVWELNAIPVIVDPDLEQVSKIDHHAVVDARLLKNPVYYSLFTIPRIIGLGPGFTAGENCHAVIETKRGHSMGRVYWSGSAEADSGLPEGDQRRVIRAPRSGVVRSSAQIGDRLKAGDLIAEVDQTPITAPFDGMLRGLIRPGLIVSANIKIGDLDPRGDPNLCKLVSDKALAVGGGVLEALFS